MPLIDDVLSIYRRDRDTKSRIRQLLLAWCVTFWSYDHQVSRYVCMSWLKTLQLARISQAVMDRSSRLPSMLSACVHCQLKLARHVTKNSKNVYTKKKLMVRKPVWSSEMETKTSPFWHWVHGDCWCLLVALRTRTGTTQRRRTEMKFARIQLELTIVFTSV